MDLDQNPDVVIVGAGIGGSALACALSEANLRVVLLEKTLEHKDVVRGEWMAPWGVAEADKLGLTSVYEAHGAHRPDRFIGYNEHHSREQAENAALVFGEGPVCPPLCIGHPRACDVLNRVACEKGAQLCRGIQRLKVTPGTPPRVEFTWQDRAYDLEPRWVVGADGRNGIVARQIGATLSHDDEHHLFSGMLVEDAHAWPEDLQVIATEGDAHVLAFPQGDGRVRVYLGWPKEDRTRLMGPEGPRNFLDSWQLDCVPDAAAIYNAKPASPCIAYPNHDSWVDHLVCEGVVLIGDAAGRNDPIIGQGLSVTHRDVRLVRDAMLDADSWHESTFDGYVAERKSRMERLRIVARIASLRDAAFGESGRRLRQDIHDRIDARPDLAAPISAAFLGPETLPEEVFSEAFTTEIVGQPIWSDLP